MAAVGSSPDWGGKASLLVGLGVFLGQGNSGEYYGYFINFFLSLINAWTATCMLCLLVLFSISRYLCLRMASVKE